MSRSQPDSKPIKHLAAQQWTCPFCRTGNAVPEVETCACGAVRVGDHAELSEPKGGDGDAEKPVATPEKPAPGHPAK